MNENKRAGEISPVLRWVTIGKDRELPDYDEYVLWRTEEGNYYVEAIDKDDADWWNGTPTNNGTSCRPTCTHWARIPFEEIHPTPAPEVKEGINLEKVQKGIDQLWESETPESLKEWHANHTVKDTPVEQINPLEEWVEATTPPGKEGHYNVITEANCFVISAYEMGDWGYNRQTDEMSSMAGMGTADRVARYRPSTYQPFLEDHAPTEQPAHVPYIQRQANYHQVQQYCDRHGEHYFGHCSKCPQPTITTSSTAGIISVPDPKGEIPDDITDWITHTAEQIWENERAIMEPGELATKVATAMYRKMREEIGQFKRAARIASQNEDYCKQWLYKARQERDALQTTLDTAQQSKQVLIDALTAKSEESADCRKALGKIVFGSDGMLSLPDRARMYGIAQQTLAKYPKP